MFSNRLAFAALAIACLGAAAGGGYLATRQNAVPAPVQAVSAPGSTPSPTAASVRETEALVGETPSKSVSPVAEAPLPSASAADTKRSGAVARANPLTHKAPERPAAGGAKPAALPVLERSWPGGAATTTPPAAPNSASSTASPPSDAAQAPRTEERVAQDAPRAAEPPQKTLEDLVVSTDSVIGLQAETSLSSERARVEDRVEARVTRDVRVRDMVAIPAGARAVGSVVSVERGGRFRERARLGIRFNTLVLADGTRLPISTETIYREGEAPGKDSMAKMTGATVGGAILGAIIGGGKGAAIGATAGAGAGAAAVMAGDRNVAGLRSGEPMTVRLLAPVSVTIERK